MRAAWVLLVGVLPLLGACARGSVGPSPGAADSEPTTPSGTSAATSSLQRARGFAVVPAGATLRLAPRDDAPGYVWSDKPDRRWPTPGAAVRVLGEVDGYVAIETLGHDELDDHCGWGLDALRHFRLRMYIRRAELGPVLNAVVTKEFDDGTSVTLQAGTAVRFTGPSGRAYASDAAGLRIAVELVPGAIGTFYQPGPGFERGPVVGVVPRTAKLSGDVGELQSTHALGGDQETLDVFAAEQHDGQHLLTFANRCATVRAFTDVAPEPKPKGGLYAMTGIGPTTAPDTKDVWGALTEAGPGRTFAGESMGLAGTGRGAAPIRAHYVKAGTAGRWADGREAGRVVGDHLFVTEVRKQGTRACFGLPAGRPDASVVELCFDAAEVTRVEASRGPLGLGNVGMMGKGFEGKRTPQVRFGEATVTGPLDKDAARRVVRAHLNEVRSCYNQGLVRDPELNGRVAIDFEVSAAGKVSMSEVASSALADDRTAPCIAKAVKRWKFPEPEAGGVATVQVPFELSPR